MDNAVYNNIKEDEPVNVGVPQVATGGAIIAPTGAPYKGNVAVVPSKFSQLGISQSFVGVGESIQDAIEAMHRAGGGEILLLNGTHNVATNITVYENIRIIGETLNTIVDFSAGAYQFQFHGTNAYSTGTIAINNGSQIITGTATAFVTAGITTNQRILIRGIWYNIQSIDSNTQITISVPYYGRNITGESYVIATYIVLGGISNLLIQNSTISGISIKYASTLHFQNIEFLKTGINIKGFDIIDSSRISIQKCAAKGTSRAFAITRSGLCTISDFLIVNDENVTAAITITDSLDSFSYLENVNCLNVTGDAIEINNCSNIQMKDGSALEGGGIGIEFVGSCSNIRIHNYLFENNVSNGIKLTSTSDNCFILESSFIGNADYGINIAASNCDNNILIGNYFNNNTNGSIQDLGTGTIIKSHSNQQFFGLEKQFYTMTNNSGVQRIAGEVVIMNPEGAVINGFTTTTTQGNDKVLGVVAETIASLAAGRIQILGNVTTLKVNGTTAIAIGDMLGTFTAAGIAMKASAGDMCFAIALEAYAVADSNGIIDALLITPRLI